MRVGGTTSQNRQTDLGILLLVAINVILREWGNGLDGSLFVDDLAIYNKTRNQKVAIRAF